MKKIFCILVLLLSTGCAVYPTSYHGYNPNPVVVYPSHHSYWHGYSRGYRYGYGRGYTPRMRHW